MVRSRKGSFWSLCLLCLSVTFLSLPARADVIPPDVAACENKKENDVCKNSSGDGTCQKSKCTKNDYSQGTPPKTVEYDCLKCLSGNGAGKEVTGGGDAGSTKDSGDNGGGGCDIRNQPNFSFGFGMLMLLGALLSIWRLATRSSR